MDRYNQGFRDGERDFDEMHKVRRILLAVLKQLLYKEAIKWTQHTTRAEKGTETARNVLKNTANEQKKRPDGIIGSSFLHVPKITVTYA